mmetsp:Transcript_12977/g.42472  ORF Transcript_12977/g.42472 Transcript_12977/m.42472 type:complete len:287 (-) Transcript_12977:990-1850(-)
MSTKGAASASPSAAVARCINEWTVAYGCATGRAHAPTTASGCSLALSAGNTTFLMWMASSSSSLALATSYALCCTASAAMASRCCRHACASSYRPALISSRRMPSKLSDASGAEGESAGEAKAPGGLRTSMERKVSSSSATRRDREPAPSVAGPSKPPKSPKSSAAAGASPAPPKWTPPPAPTGGGEGEALLKSSAPAAPPPPKPSKSSPPTPPPLAAPPNPSPLKALPVGAPPVAGPLNPPNSSSSGAPAGSDAPKGSDPKPPSPEPDETGASVPPNMSADRDPS